MINTNIIEVSKNKSFTKKISINVEFFYVRYFFIRGNSNFSAIRREKSKGGG